MFEIDFPLSTKINIPKFQFDHGPRATSLSAHTAVTCYPRKTKTFIHFISITTYWLYKQPFQNLLLLDAEVHNKNISN
jgi:hypothetical protein